MQAAVLEQAKDAMLRAKLAALLPELRAFARFLAASRSEADDLVQEALLRALRMLDRVEDEAGLRPWCLGILRNVFHETRRRKRREALHAQQSDPEGSISAPQEAQGDLSDLSHALRNLSPTLREAVLLVGAQGLSYEEAAEVCAVPVGTMKARVSRARTLLAGSLGGALAPVTR